MLPILCACLSALLLSPGMAQTRRIIAAANVPSGTSQPTVVAAQVTPTQESIGNPLNSPLLTPTVETTPPIDATAPTPSQSPAPTEPVFQSTAFNQPTRTRVPSPTPLNWPTLAATPTATTVIVATVAVPPTFTPPSAPSATVTTAALTSPVATPNPTGGNTATPTASATVAPPTAPVTITSTSSPPPTSTVVIGSQASGAVSIINIMFRGDPDRNQADQFVEIKNSGAASVNMSSWTLQSASTNKIYVFPNGFSILAQQVCRIYTNSPSMWEGCGPFSFNSLTPVWSDTNDMAELRDSTGAMMARYCYGPSPNAACSQ